MVRQRTRRSPQLAPLTVLFALTAAGFVFFWQSSGTRALLLLALGLIVAVVVDGAWGFRALADPAVTLAVPADGTVGEPVPVRVTVTGVSRPVLLALLSVPGSPPARVCPPETGVLEVVPLVSGRFPWAIVELSVRGPLGLVGWLRRLVVELPSPLYVAPRPVPNEVRFPVSSGSRTGLTAGTAAQLDLIRSIRDYVPGDSSRLIHWGHTAHAGQLMVKELDPAGAGDLTIVVDLHADHPGSEAAAGRAVYLADRALREGWAVRLVTRESADPVDAVMPRLTGNRLPIQIVKRPAAHSRTVAAPAVSPTDVNRRLAAADFGPPDLPRRPAGVVRVVTSSGEDVWL